MQVAQVKVSGPDVSSEAFAPLERLDPHLVVVFGSVQVLPAVVRVLTTALPHARRIGCSTAGEISGEGVDTGSAVVTGVRFRTPQFRTARAPLPSMESSADSGRQLAHALRAPDLRSILLYGQGVRINGSAVIEGIGEVVGSGIPITGGLAGDDGAFERTFTVFDDTLSSHDIVGVGFYGDSVRLGHGCFGGWTAFGPPRKITRAAGNVLYELDGAPALDLYKRYLGEYARDLPAAGLLYPFELLDNTRSELGLIRTILGVDEQQKSLTLAGDLVDGGYLRLMHASTDALVEGAEAAARAAHRMVSERTGGLTILVSCVGRRLVMGGRVDEEVEAVAEVYGSGTTITGFYSYGEISPYLASPECRLHNQTMTVTHLYEPG